MTMTSVVLGIATLGTPEATPDCDCAFIVFSFRFSLVSLLIEYDSTLMTQKNYSSAKHFMKKLRASINICSRF